MVADAVIAFRVGATLMVAAGAVAVFFAVAAEQRPLEDIATPPSAARSDEGDTLRRPAARNAPEPRSGCAPGLRGRSTRIRRW
ncbi:hypothetical protein EES46_19020 [Streptomyces sp. ADI98-10]|nr:hypothetical protein EES46_19020 [Streptomyces sp. ADI98-10]